MEILRKTKGINVYYELGLKSTDRLDYSIQMLQNNRFSRLLPVRLQCVDMEYSLLYKADGMQSFASRFQGQEPEISAIRELLTDFASAIRELQDHLMLPEGIVLRSAWIFHDEQRGHYRFLYTPEPEQGFSQGMKLFMEELMPHFSHRNKDGVVQFYDLYGRFLNDLFTPELFLAIVDGWSEQRVDPHGSAYSAYGRSPQFPLLPAYSPETDVLGEAMVKPALPQAKEKRKVLLPVCVGIGLLLLIFLISGVVFGNAGLLKLSAVLAGLLAAVLLCHFLMAGKEQKAGTAAGTAFVMGVGTVSPSPSIRVNPVESSNIVPTVYPASITRLIPAEQQGMEPIDISEGIYRIGREPEVNEYCIPRPGISRNHASLSCENGVVRLKDMDSTNGTYVNQKKLQGMTAEELHYGDVVSFAGEEYYCV